MHYQSYTLTTIYRYVLQTMSFPICSILYHLLLLPLLFAVGLLPFLWWGKLSSLSFALYPMSYQQLTAHQIVGDIFILYIVDIKCGYRAPMYAHYQTVDTKRCHDSTNSPASLYISIVAISMPHSGQLQ